MRTIVLASALVVAAAPAGAATLRIVAGGKAQRAPVLRVGGALFVELSAAARALRALGAEVTESGPARVLAVSLVGVPDREIALPPEGEPAFTLLVNGKTATTRFEQRDGRFFLPVPALAAIARALGSNARWDDDAGVAVLPRPKVSAPAAQNAPRAVKRYLTALKKLFDENKPTAAQKMLFSGLAMGMGQISPAHIASIRGQFERVLEGTRALASPPAECARIHALALSVFEASLKLFDRGVSMITSGDTSAIPAVYAARLAILQDGAEFDRLVRSIRTRYGMGPP